MEMDGARGDSACKHLDTADGARGHVAEGQLRGLGELAHQRAGLAAGAVDHGGHLGDVAVPVLGTRGPDLVAKLVERSLRRVRDREMKVEIKVGMVLAEEDQYTRWPQGFARTLAASVVLNRAAFLGKATARRPRRVGVAIYRKQRHTYTLVSHTHVLHNQCHIPLAAAPVSR